MMNFIIFIYIFCLLYHRFIHEHTTMEAQARLFDILDFFFFTF